MRQIEEYIKENLSDTAERIASELVSFLRENNFELERDIGYWKDKIYYIVRYRENCICFIAIKDPDEKENLWTVWSDDISSDILNAFAVDEELTEAAWRHIDHCCDCGSCGGGRHKVIFGREFDDVCGCTFRFDNPDKQDLKLMKRLFSMHKENLK